MNPICDFIERCDQVAARRRVRRSTLSTMLFNDGKRLDQLAAGKSDIGVLRLEAAKKELATITAALDDIAA